MPIQTQVNVDTRPFILEDMHATRDDKAVVLQDGGRATPLLSRTLMAQIAATGKYVPYTDIAAVDGSGIPIGVFDPEGSFGDILAADIVAGDVVDLPIIKFGFSFDKDKLVIENALTLQTVIVDGIQTQTVENAMINKSMVATDAESASRFENS